MNRQAGSSANRSKLQSARAGEDYRVVWFKRDLRVHDHAALVEAARAGPVLCLYIVEPELWRQPETSRLHARFVEASLTDLDLALQRLGGRLEVVLGGAVDVFDRLHALAPFSAMHAHEETGGSWTYARDRDVAQWCRLRGVRFIEHAQTGVVRGLRDRDGWSRAWNQFMAQPILAARRFEGRAMPWPCAAINLTALPSHPEDATDVQQGGLRAGAETLEDFLSARAAQYRGGISSPLSAPTACSRLSPYLAYGCLSMRQTVQATWQHTMDDRLSTPKRQGLRAFIGRLHWHCHFIQKLESEPAIEQRNFHRGFDGLREHDWNLEHYQRLIQARTGWPMVDACVAMLRQTGWLNFRMRAMLVSVAAFPLWLHWRPFGLWLARWFLDYEPGIHWSQMQMQSGTTGINTARVYSPIKQAHDHDPDGEFVRRWLPYMRDVPKAHTFEPWRWRCGEAEHLPPQPVVDLQAATAAAKQRYYACRRAPGMRAAAEQVLDRHGSRRRPAATRSNRPARATPRDVRQADATPDRQMDLPL